MRLLQTRSLLCVLLFVPQGYNNSKAVTLEASFTPDSQFIMIGKIILPGQNFSALKSGVLCRNKVVSVGKQNVFKRHSWEVALH